MFLVSDVLLYTPHYTPTPHTNRSCRAWLALVVWECVPVPVQLCARCDLRRSRVSGVSVASEGSRDSPRRRVVSWLEVGRHFDICNMCIHVLHVCDRCIHVLRLYKAADKWRAAVVCYSVFGLLFFLVMLTPKVE